MFRIAWCRERNQLTPAAEALGIRILLAEQYRKRLEGQPFVKSMTMERVKVGG